MNETAIAVTRDYTDSAWIILRVVVRQWDDMPEKHKRESVKKALELISIALERLDATCGDEGRNYRKVLR